jgi:hypothetical protein
MPDEQLHRLEKAMKVLMLSALRELGQKEQIDILDRAGFGQTEIGDLIGTSSKAVSVRLAEIRKARKAAKGKPRG